MEAVAVRFKRAMAPFSELARVRLCESSGSEHSAAADSSLELEDLVDSFLFDDGEEEAAELKPKVNDDDDDDEDEEMTEKNKEEKNYEEREMIHSLLRRGGVVLLDEKIRTEIELACQRIGMVPGTEIYKRRLMRELRKKGFDAGMCYHALRIFYKCISFVLPNVSVYVSTCASPKIKGERKNLVFSCKNWANHGSCSI